MPPVEVTEQRDAFARRMHEVCDALGIPPGRGRQTALGKRFGVTPKAARKWLEGLGYPDLDLALRIAHEARVSALWLLQGEGPKYLAETRNQLAERVGDIVDSLPPQERQQALDFIRYKVERSGKWYSAEQLGRYMSFLDRLARSRR
ncbi:MAG: hypothetical protein N2688_01825 [Burkholderiaceae bacterium]|nr:hypothetical protein [Burkholderiaceae bacterium]